MQKFDVGDLVTLPNDQRLFQVVEIEDAVNGWYAIEECSILGKRRVDNIYWQDMALYSPFPAFIPDIIFNNANELTKRVGVTREEYKTLTCTHPNKRKTLMITTSFMYCPDCKEKVGECND